MVAKQKSGAQKRKERVARGLPACTAEEIAAGRRYATQRTIKKRIEIVQKIGAMKVESGCSDCGYSAHSVALDFDHLPQFDKRDGIARLILKTQNWEVIAAEIAKCEVVCANCHRVRTAARTEGRVRQIVAGAE